MAERERPTAEAVLRAVLPYGIVARVQQRRASAAADAEEAQRIRERTRRLQAAEARRSGGDVSWDYEAGIKFLLDRGLDDYEVRDGSMPEASLRYVGDAIREHLPAGEPVRALHVGNFVGVSLAHITATLRELDPRSVVLAVDPDISHRGIVHPAGHTMRMIRHFGLQDNVLNTTAYSLQQNLGNDGLDEWDDRASAQDDIETAEAGEQALAQLRVLAEGRFDLAMLDGNHDATYLRTELEHTAALLRPGGILILDDVVEGIWSAIARGFEALFEGPSPAFERIGVDGRVGIARRAA